MKRTVIFVVLLCTVLLSVVSVTAVSAQGTSREYIILAKGETSVSQTIKSQITAAGGTITRDLSSMGMIVASSTNPQFRSLIPSAKAVVPNVKIQWLEPNQVVMESVSINVSNPPNTGDDDFFLDLQWGHDAVNAFEAWEDPEPGRGHGVRVAVIDSGIDADHPDIAPNLNMALSTSFVPGESVFVRPGVFFSHGTHVAGTIGGADNGFGIVGVAPEVELVAIKSLSEFSGSGEWDWLVASIKYAGDIRADVINMSLGGVLDVRGGCDTDEDGNPIDCYTAQDVIDLRDSLARAVRYAMRRGATVIASAGNSAIDFGAWDNRYLVDFPASVPGVVVISAYAPRGWALDPANADFYIPSSYTNGGREFVDFGAPGGDDSYPGNEVCTVGSGLGARTRACWIFDLVFSAATADGGSAFYSWAGGTSMAAPHASGVAAIIIGWNGGSMRPDLVFAEMRRLANFVGPATTTYFGQGAVSAEWHPG
jgi:subtilisin family serine protease